VNYAIRFSGPVTGPPRPVRSRPHLPARPSPRYEDGLVLRRFSNSSLCAFPRSFFPSRSCTGLPSCLRPRRAPLAPFGPLVSTEPILRGQLGKCRSTTTGSYSLDASAALSRRPSDCASTLENGADEAPGVPASRRRFGHATTSHAGVPVW
jgi:hypothetical protein